MIVASEKCILARRAEELMTFDLRNKEEHLSCQEQREDLIGTGDTATAWLHFGCGYEFRRRFKP